MVDNNRFAELIEYLITNKIVRNQQEFVEKIGSDNSAINLKYQSVMKIVHENVHKI